MLASVLRKIDRGVFLRNLRFPPRHSMSPTRAQVGTLSKWSFISLGRAIIAFYIITLLTAFISARTLAENELGQPLIPGVEPHATAPSAVDD